MKNNLILAEIIVTIKGFLPLNYLIVYFEGIQIIIYKYAIYGIKGSYQSLIS